MRKDMPKLVVQADLCVDISQKHSNKILYVRT